MNPRSDRIGDDNQALQCLKRTREKLTEISEDIYHYEPRSIDIKEAYSVVQMNLEEFIRAIEKTVRRLEEGESS